MRELLLIITCAILVISCNDEEMNPPFEEDEVFSVLNYSINGEMTEMFRNESTWNTGIASNEQGVEIEGIHNKGFGSVFTLNNNSDGRNHFEISLSKWFNANEIEIIDINPAIPNEFAKPNSFLDAFAPGDRIYSENLFPNHESDVVTVSFFDDDLTFWASNYGSNDSPGSKFTILRSMAIGSDSVFVEVSFEVKLYNGDGEYIEIENGYFKGFYKRTIL